jgi:transposase
MGTEVAPSCANCQRLQAQLDALQATVAQLQATLAQVQEQLAAARKDSSTSSKPPSSDLVKPPKPPPPPGQDQRRIGGQPGHPKHERLAFPPEQVNAGTLDYRLPGCPACGHDLQPALPPFAVKVVQQVDLGDLPLLIQEHRCPPSWCPACQEVFYAPLPDPVVRAGLIGPRLTTLIAYLKGFCHASFSTIRKFLRDVVGVTVSRGQLAKVVAKVSQALERPYDELLERLPHEAQLNVDETGHKDRGRGLWTWCFRASLYTLFWIDPTRSAEVLLEVLGQEFDGVLGCDCFSAYRRYMRECGVVVQFCLAHLIRDVKFLTTLPDARERAYGERLREALRQLFAVIHREPELTPGAFQRQLQAARDAVLVQGTTGVPAGPHSQTLAKRLRTYGESYFTFVTTPGVEPTNNLAEQAIRFVVIDRHITQGTRGERGQRWCERIWTVMASCVQQGRSVFDYLSRAVEAWLGGSAAPSLLPQE